LTKRYGWGIHNDKDEKMAIFGAESSEYKKLSKDITLKDVKAMKSSKYFKINSSTAILIEI